MAQTQIYSAIKSCRACGNQNLIDVVDLGDHYLSGVFPSKKEANLIPKVPLKLVKCEGKDCCELVQLSVSVNPKLMYGDNYGYRSGLNQSMVTHLRNKVSKIEQMLDLGEDDTIIDIGSNDCTTLKSYSNSKSNFIGIDPTGDKFKDFYPENVQLVADFFPCEKLKNILKGNKASVITSFSMFYDLEAPVEFARTIRDYLNDEGIWIFEQSYLPFMLDSTSFDTICHEHLEYYDLKSVNYICKSAGLKIIDVEFNSVNGGSFSITSAKADSKHKEYHLLEDLMTKEDKYRSPQAFKNFRDKIKKAKIAMRDFLNNALIRGDKVMGIGASTKGNTLLQYFNISSNMLPEIGEINTEKVGKTTPGTGIKITTEKSIIEKKPDYLLILPWHFSEFFKKSCNFKGFKLVFPLPEFTIFNSESDQ